MTIRMDHDVIAAQDAVAARQTDEGMPRWAVFAKWPPDRFFSLVATFDGRGNAEARLANWTQQGASVRLVDLSTAVIVKRRGE